MIIIIIIVAVQQVILQFMYICNFILLYLLLHINIVSLLHYIHIVHSRYMIHNPHIGDTYVLCIYLYIKDIEQIQCIVLLLYIKYVIHICMCFCVCTMYSSMQKLYIQHRDNLLCFFSSFLQYFYPISFSALSYCICFAFFSSISTSSSSISLFVCLYKKEKIG